MLTKLQIVQAIQKAYPELELKEIRESLNAMIEDQAHIRYGKMFNMKQK